MGWRWAIEHCYEEAKTDLGMDHYEVRKYSGGITKKCGNREKAVSPRGCPNPPDNDPAKKGDTAMEQKITPHVGRSSDMWGRLEVFVREHIQRFIQTLLEEEVTALVGRPKAARRGAVDAPAGMRNG